MTSWNPVRCVHAGSRWASRSPLAHGHRGRHVRAPHHVRDLRGNRAVMCLRAVRLTVSFESCASACAGKARSRGTRCRDVIFETLFETLWVSNPIRPRSAASRNRVMRGPGVTQGAKRSQGARRPRD